MDKVKVLLDRLAGVNWAEVREPTQDDLAKVKSYLDSLADLSAAHAGLGIFFSPSNLVGSPVLNESQQAQLTAVLPADGHAYEAVFCRNAVEWAALVERQEAIAIKLADLYDPLIDVIENRVPLRSAKGYLMAGEHAFPMQRWPTGYGRTGGGGEV